MLSAVALARAIAARTKPPAIPVARLAVGVGRIARIQKDRPSQVVILVRRAARARQAPKHAGIPNLLGRPATFGGAAVREAGLILHPCLGGLGILCAFVGTASTAFLKVCRDIAVFLGATGPTILKAYLPGISLVATARVHGVDRARTEKKERAEHSNQA
jgi:hypothetical protein